VLNWEKVRPLFHYEFDLSELRNKEEAQTIKKILENNIFVSKVYIDLQMNRIRVQTEARHFQQQVIDDLEPWCREKRRSIEFKSVGIVNRKAMPDMVNDCEEHDFCLEKSAVMVCDIDPMTALPLPHPHYLQYMKNDVGRFDR
jgi:hypothetical protein